MYTQIRSCSAFNGTRLIARGTPLEVALIIKSVTDNGAAEPILVFDDDSSQAVDFDLRGSEADIRSRIRALPARKPGRPKLGVTAREVTLLPRHWDWLAEQPRGASATLRQIVEQAMRSDQRPSIDRKAGEAVQRFMTAMTGNLPNHEEATRAFWRNDQQGFAALIDSWPRDVRDHRRGLVYTAWNNPKN